LGLKAVSHQDPTIDRFDKSGGISLEFSRSDQTVRLTPRLTRQGDAQDLSDKVAVKESSGKIKMAVSLPGQGEYKLALYAGKKDESDKRPVNVFNYRLLFSAGDDSSLQKKKKGMFKS